MCDVQRGRNRKTAIAACYQKFSVKKNDIEGFPVEMLRQDAHFQDLYTRITQCSIQKLVQQTSMRSAWKKEANNVEAPKKLDYNANLMPCSADLNHLAVR